MSINTTSSENKAKLFT